MSKLTSLRTILLAILLIVPNLVLAMGMGMGGDGTVGTVENMSITVDSTNGDGTLNLWLYWKRQGGSGSNGHLKSWKLTVSDGSTTEYSCENSHVHNDTDGDDVGKNNTWVTNGNTSDKETDHYELLIKPEYWDGNGLNKDIHNGQTSPSNTHIGRDLLVKPPGTYTFTVTIYAEERCDSGDEGQSASGSLPNVTINDPNDPPVLTGDLAATINEGDTYDLTTSDLFYTDSDSDDDNAGVTFTISNLDSALTLTVNGSAASTFTGTQLAAEQVTFTHSGIEDDSATFDVNVEDGNEDSSTPADSTFTFTINDQNDPPEITGDLAITVDTDGTVYLTQTDLYYSDADDSHISGGVTFEITANPSKGSLETWSSAEGGGGTWTTFDASAGTRWANRTTLVPTGDPPTAFRYIHDSNNGVGDDSFQIIVEDGNEDDSTPSGSPYVETITVTVNPAAGLDHYAVTLSPNSATTCGIIGVTLTAHDASHSAVVTDHSVTLGVSSAGPTWNDTGSATIAKTFTSATVTANLRSSSVVSNVQIELTDTNDGNIGLDSGESPTFGFTGANSSLTFTGPGNLTAGLNNILPTATIAVTTPADCTAAGTGDLNTDFYFTCLDPNNCINGQDLTINNQAVSSSSGSPTSVSLGFTNGTSAPFEVNYEDVGQVQLAAAVTIAATGDNPAHTVTGSTTFVSKPADFILALDSNSASGGFKAAGEAFTIGTTATNLDGNPTPNYGAEATPETLTASFVSLVAPSDGANGSLSPGTYTHAGSGVGSLAGVTYSETGTINLQVGTDSDYLGTGSQINSSAVTTGRFYPSYFTSGQQSGY